jgi:hypothetical protein
MRVARIVIAVALLAAVSLAHALLISWAGLGDHIVQDEPGSTWLTPLLFLPEWLLIAYVCVVAAKPRMPDRWMAVSAASVTAAAVVLLLVSMSLVRSDLGRRSLPFEVRDLVQIVAS